jgi:peptide/nickel transport system substrate-binding protein
VKFRRSSLVRVTVVTAALALVLTACGSSSKNSGNGSGNGNTAAGPTGSVVFGAEQWPDCVNPINQCANSSWLQWLVPIHVLPRLAELDEKNNFVASPVLKELPTVANGGVTGAGKTFTVTYHLNPDAKWTPDNTPITSADVVFTWHAYLETTGSLSTTGYDQISSIETPDAQTAVVHFKETYNDWPDVMGGFSGVVLEKAAFPTVTGPKIDLGKTMTTSLPFSAGPWTLTSFSKDKEVLTANTSYFDKARIPKIKTVTFVPVTDTTKEVQAIKTGQVSAVYPQPSTDNVPQLKDSATLKSLFGVTTQYEDIWFNTKPGHPFQDKNVRAAMSYAIDRTQLLNDIIKPFDPTVEQLNCAAWVPGVGKWCENVAFAGVKADPTKVDSFMAAAGYAKDSKGIWAKGGKELTIAWMENTGNKRRENMQAEFIPLLAKEGFKVTPDNSDADTMFQKRLPAGDFDMAVYIQVTSPDPTVTSILNTAQIPSAANKGQGQNDTWFSDPAADTLMLKADGELDVNKRLDEVHQLDKILAADYVNLPLYAFPSMLTYRTDVISGPVDKFINSPESNFWNMWEWTTK